MTRVLVAFLVTAAIFLALDFVWLTRMSDFYRRAIGTILADPFRLAPALAFYVIYVCGIVGFAVHPALTHGGGWIYALIAGAGLGLVAYATYGFTNNATLAAWPLHLTLVDTAWGTFATAASASIATVIVARIFGGAA